MLKQTVGSSVGYIFKLHELKAGWLDRGLWQRDSWAIMCLDEGGASMDGHVQIKAHCFSL